MAKKKKNKSIVPLLAKVERKEEKGDDLETVKSKLPYYGLLDTGPTEDMGLISFSTETLENELKWLRRYYRKFKHKSDLNRIKEIKKEIESRLIDA